MVLRRLKQLGKKMEKNPELFANVCMQVDEYQKKEYAHLATPEELNVTEPQKTRSGPSQMGCGGYGPGRLPKFTVTQGS